MGFAIALVYTEFIPARVPPEIFSWIKNEDSCVGTEVLAIKVRRRKSAVACPDDDGIDRSLWLYRLGHDQRQRHRLSVLVNREAMVDTRHPNPAHLGISDRRVPRLKQRLH